MVSLSNIHKVVVKSITTQKVKSNSANATTITYNWTFGASDYMAHFHVCLLKEIPFTFRQTPHFLGQMVLYHINMDEW